MLFTTCALAFQKAPTLLQDWVTAQDSLRMGTRACKRPRRCIRLGARLHCALTEPSSQAHVQVFMRQVVTFVSSLRIRCSSQTLKVPAMLQNCCRTQVILVIALQSSSLVACAQMLDSLIFVALHRHALMDTCSLGNVVPCSAMHLWFWQTQKTQEIVLRPLLGGNPVQT